MTSAEEKGIIRIKFTDQNETNPQTVLDVHSNVVSGAVKAYPTGETLKAIPKVAFSLRGNLLCKGRVVLYFVSDSADILESEESALELPCLLYDEKSGRLLGTKQLTFENLTGFTAGGTVDVSCGAGVEQRIAYYDVPRGILLGLDPNGQMHGYMGDDT